MAADPATRTAIDDIFDDNFSDFGDDPFADKPTTKDQRDDKAILSPRAPKRKAGEDGDAFGLGLDEEVKIAKKRQPVAKLDEARLLSEPGIPKLRSLVRTKTIKKKLRLKGKGHEFTDAARLLNHFQLWLDNLYPRAKFADALQMVEKAGHTKRMQYTRCEWINESKPGYQRSKTPDIEENITQNHDLFTAATGGANGKTSADNEKAREASSREEADFDDSLFIPDAISPRKQRISNEPDEDELDTLLAENDTVREVNPISKSVIPAKTLYDDSEGEDDLDALLAEQETRQAQPITTNRSGGNDYAVDDDEDDLDALLAEQETRHTHQDVVPNSKSTAQPATTDKDNESDNEDLFAMHRRSRADPEADAAMSDEPELPNLESSALATQEPISNKIDSQPEELVDENFMSSSPLPNNDDPDSNGNLQAEIVDDGILDADGMLPEVLNDNDDDTGGQASHELVEDFLASSPIDLSQ